MIDIVVENFSNFFNGFSSISKARTNEKHTHATLNATNNKKERNNDDMTRRR